MSKPVVRCVFRPRPAIVVATLGSMVACGSAPSSAPPSVRVLARAGGDTIPEPTPEAGDAAQPRSSSVPRASLDASTSLEHAYEFVDDPLVAGGFCADNPRSQCAPVPFEVLPWAHAGGGLRTGHLRPVLSLGGGIDGTFDVAGITGGNLVGMRLRVGPWIGFETPMDQMRGEGGVSVTIGDTAWRHFGTFGLRLGGGHSTAGAQHLMGQVSWGTRYVPSRCWSLGTCGEPDGARHSASMASGARFFAALRRDVGMGGAYDLVFGMELPPTFFLPPYSLSSLLGDPTF